MKGGERGVVGMVADHRDDLGGQLAGAPSAEQVGQAVRLARGEHREPGALVAEADLSGHAEAATYLLGEGRGDLVASEAPPVEVELHPLEEHAGLAVDVLLGVHDVAAQIDDELGDAVHQAGLVAAGEQQDGGGDRRPLGALVR